MRTLSIEESTGLTLAIAVTPSDLKVFAVGKADAESELLSPSVWWG